MKPLTKRDFETLGELEAANRSHTRQGNYRDGWARPMDCGGHDGSHHSYTLTKLVLRGLAEVREPSKKHPGRSRYSGGKDYKITIFGLAMLGAYKRTKDL